MTHCLLSQIFAIIQPATAVTCECSSLTQKGSSRDVCSNYLSVTSLKACRYCKSFCTNISQN